MITLILLILLSFNIYSQEYVTPEELEEGWGFKYLNQLERFESKPKNEISFFEISPDEELIYVQTKIPIKNSNKLLNFTFNMKSKEFVEFD